MPSKTSCGGTISTISWQGVCRVGSCQSRDYVEIASPGRPDPHCDRAQAVDRTAGSRTRLERWRARFDFDRALVCRAFALDTEMEPCQTEWLARESRRPAAEVGAGQDRRGAEVLRAIMSLIARGSGMPQPRVVSTTHWPGLRIKRFAEEIASPKPRGTDLPRARYLRTFAKGRDLDGIAHASSSSSALASMRSTVSNPSVNQP
jgi:hypothetical protein